MNTCCPINKHSFSAEIVKKFDLFERAMILN